MGDNSYENFSREDLINWIELCQDLFDEAGIESNDKGALYSVYGRLCIYKHVNDEKISTLTTRLQEAEAIIKPIAEHAEIVNQQMNNQVMEVAHFFSVEEYARAASWLKGK